MAVLYFVGDANFMYMDGTAIFVLASLFKVSRSRGLWQNGRI